LAAWLAFGAPPALALPKRFYFSIFDFHFQFSFSRHSSLAIAMMMAL